MKSRSAIASLPLLFLTTPLFTAEPVATVTSTPETGIFSVKYERAGRPATLGWGFLLPLANEKPRPR